MKNVKRTPRGIPLKAKILSGICIAALLYGTAAQAMSDVGMLGGAAVRSIHPIHTDLVSKQYTYDADGNHVGTMSTSENENKEYDVLGRLVKYEGPEGVEEYTYIGAGANVHSVKRTPAGSTVPELTTFLYDGDNVIAEYAGEGLVLSKTYVTAGLDQYNSMTIRNGSDAGTYYYTQDALGSVRLLTDAAGTARNVSDYTAFGEPFNQRAVISQPYGFTGREYSPIAGNLCYRHRSYSPITGRFDKRDPAGYDYNAHGDLYAYVDNQPTRFVDPYGLWSSNGHRKLTENAMQQTGCNVCTDQMIAANVGVDGGWLDGFAWFLDDGRTPNHAAAAPHYMAWNNIYGFTDREAAKKRSLDLIDQLIGEAHAHARKGDCDKGAVALGKALHTIQDKYSHSNDRGMPITNSEHKAFNFDIDKPLKNPVKYQGAQNESNAVVQQYVDILTNEGCYPCKK